ncbi:hypothetical protein [Burkholderia contaminans]|jgi:hypothetical protein|uniref:hypothetical protein n=1 Tax=Burkholderia contaminans TaxID=488447 RepID=UPI00115FDFD2|nr:hypothetical protein [Burkholderia contaminans]
MLDNPSSEASNDAAIATWINTLNTCYFPVTQPNRFNPIELIQSPNDEHDPVESKVSIDRFVLCPPSIATRSARPVDRRLNPCPPGVRHDNSEHARHHSSAPQRRARHEKGK